MINPDSTEPSTLDGHATLSAIASPAPQPIPDTLSKKTISELTADANNANKGTKRGAELIAESLKRYGAARSIVIDKHGRIIAGNKTIENARAAGFSDVLIVKTDGSQIVAVQRTDLDLLEDDKAKELAIADNRSSELSLDWDGDVLKELDVEINLKAFFTDEVLSRIILDSDPQFDPASIDEQGRLDEKAPVECPNCGHKFSPK